MIITRDTFFMQRITPRDNRFFASHSPWVSVVECDLMPLAHQGIPIVLPTGLTTLPQALISPTRDDAPFGEHTPRLWQHYPFSLTQHVVGLEADDSGQLGTILQGDPEAPHWSDTMGYPLFDANGQASTFLKKTLTGLRAVQRDVMQMQQLIWRLHALRVLKSETILHEKQRIEIYRIDMEILHTRLGGSEAVQDTRLLMVADIISMSQANLEAIEQPRMSHWQSTRCLNP